MPTMRSPEGQIYEVPDDQVDELQRDQGFTLGEDAPEKPEQPSAILRSREGRLYEATSPEEYETLQRDQDMVPASPEEVATMQQRRERYQKYGGAGQQALGLAETFYRTATLGVMQGIVGDEEEQRDRALETAEESPVLNTLAGAAPAIAAGVATGGAGLGAAATIAAEGAIGGYGALGTATDEAFKADQELSAEAAFGAFGKGAILGAGLAGAVVGAPRALEAIQGGRGIRNRFAEAAGRAERRAERSAFRGVGIDDPVDGLGDAVVDPAKGAKVRARGRGAALDVREQFGKNLEELEKVERAARAWNPPRAAAEGDVAAQRAAVRRSLDELRSGMKTASDDERGMVSRAFDALDRAETADDVYEVVGLTRRTFDDVLRGSADPATAGALQKAVQRLEALKRDADLFGAPSVEAIRRGTALEELAAARELLDHRLAEGNYLASIGMRAGKPTEEALGNYIDRLTAVLDDSPGMSERAAMQKALASMNKLRAGAMREVAGLNQIDAMSGVDPGDLRPRPPGFGEFVIDAAETVAKTAAMPQWAAYTAAKYAWKAARVSRIKDPVAKARAAKKLAADAAKMGAGFVDPVIGPALKAYKYRHHIAVLAETAKDEAVQAAGKLVGAVKREGAVPLAARMAKQNLTPEDYEKVKKAVEVIAKEPERMADHLATQMGNMVNDAPELVELVNKKAAVAVQFLASKIPPSFGFSMLYPDGPPPSRTDVVVMSMYLNGVTNPEDVVAAIGNGTAMPEEVEAFRAVYTAWFAEIQQDAIDQAMALGQAGKPVSGYRVAELETLLDLPGKLDPTFGDDVAGIAQSFRNQFEQRQQAPSYVPQPRAGERIKTETLDTELA